MNIDENRLARFGNGRHRLFLFAFICAHLRLLASSHAWAVEPAVVVHEDLRREEVQFLGASDGRLRFFGADRSLTTLDTQKVVRLELSRSATEVGAGLVRMTDGQVIRGKRVSPGAAGDEGGDTLSWETRFLGTVRVPLERVASFALSDRVAEAAPASDSDVVLMANGDRLTGFVEGQVPRGLVLEREGKKVELAWESIAAVSLANPVRAEAGTWVQLTDGSRVRVEGLVVTGESVSGSSMGSPISMGVRALARIDFSERHRLVPLGGLPWRVEAGGQAFGVDYPPRFESGWVSLHAPVTVRFTLPAGATRFAADVRIEAESIEAADMVLVVTDGTKELWSERLNRSKPAARVSVEVGSGALVIQLDEGAGGAVRDRLQLDNAEVLVTP